MCGCEHIMGEFKEGIPVVLVRGLKLKRCESDIKEVLFSREEDLFR